MIRRIARRHQYTFDDLRAVYPRGEPAPCSPRRTMTALMLTFSAFFLGVASIQLRPPQSTSVQSLRWVLYEEDGVLRGRIAGRWPKGGTGQVILGHWTTTWTRGRAGVVLARVIDRTTLQFSSDRADMCEPQRERILAFMRRELTLRREDMRLQSFGSLTHAGATFVDGVGVGPDHGRVYWFATTLRIMMIIAIATAIVGFPMLLCIANGESHRRRYRHLESLAQAAVDAQICPACRYPRGEGDRCTECGRLWPTPNR